MPDDARSRLLEIDKATLDALGRAYDDSVSMLALRVREIMANAADQKASAMRAMFEATIARTLSGDEGRVDPAAANPATESSRRQAETVIREVLGRSNGPVARSTINEAVIAEGWTEYGARKALQIMRKRGSLELRNDGFVLVGPAGDEPGTPRDDA